MSISDVIAEVKIPGYLVGKALKNGISSVLDECSIKFVSLRNPEAAQNALIPDEETGSTEQLKETAEQQDWEGKRRLVKFRCPECGRLNFKICEGSGAFVCHGCGRKDNFGIDELSRVTLTCPECNEYQYFWMPEREGMALNSIACKKCECDIAFSYSNEEGQYINF